MLKSIWYSVLSVFILGSGLIYAVDAYPHGGRVAADG